MSQRYDLLTSRKDRDGKTRYTKVGTMFPARDGKDGFTLKLDALPLPNAEGEVWVSAYPPRENGASSSRQSTRSRSEDGEDIPF